MTDFELVELPSHSPVQYLKTLPKHRLLSLLNTHRGGWDHVMKCPVCRHLAVMHDITEEDMRPSPGREERGVR